MRRRALFKLAALTLVLGAGFYVLPSASEHLARPDCPGTIVCPITGRVVCIDHCPLGAKESDEISRPACCRKAAASAATGAAQE